MGPRINFCMGEKTWDFINKFWNFFKVFLRIFKNFYQKFICSLSFRANLRIQDGCPCLCSKFRKNLRVDWCRKTYGNSSIFLFDYIRVRFPYQLIRITAAEKRGKKLVISNAVKNVELQLGFKSNCGIKNISQICNDTQWLSVKLTSPVFRLWASDMIIKSGYLFSRKMV